MATIIRTLKETGETPNHILPRTRLKAVADDNGNYLSADLTAEQLNDVPNKYKKPNTGIPKTDLASDVQTSLGKADNAVETTAQTLTDAQKAQARANINATAPDGYYGESGGVFQFSTNFLGKNTPQNASNLYFRPTASNYSGSGWSADSISGKTATIQKIKGKLLMFNQILNITLNSTTVGGLTVSADANKRLTINGTSTGAAFQPIGTAKLVKGHKYIVLINGNVTADHFFALFGSWTASASFNSIFTANVDFDGDFHLRVNGAGYTYNNAHCYVDIHDLTQMYGAGKEPQTVGEFKAQFPLDYYQYTQATPLPFKGTGLATNGLNQWDEQWENGVYSYSTGEKGGTRTDYIRSKNFIPCFPDTAYYFKMPTTMSDTMVLFYDSGYNYLGYISGITNATKTTLPNTRYMTFYGKATTYNHDISVNLKWTGNDPRYQDYEPYWDSTLSLPITTYFGSKGMRNAGSKYDWLTKDAYGLVIGDYANLDNLTWYKHGDQPLFYSEGIASKIDIKAPASGVGFDIRCPLYVTANENVTYWASGADKTILVANGVSSASSVNIVIRDSSVDSVEELKAKLANVPIYFELAEEVVTPINPPLNLTYTCDDFGTEMLLPQNTSTQLLTAPMDAEIVYQWDYEANGGRNSDQLYMNKGSMDSLVQCLNSLGIGTVSVAYDATNKKYVFTGTPAPTE